MMTVETDNTEFITKLISFGLSEKDAQLYFYLLKYGPKPSSVLAKSLKTYHEDIHRALTSLIDKGMVTPSLGSLAVYAAVELEIAIDVAIDAALKNHEAELREMDVKKQEIQELSKRQRFSLSDAFVTYKILKNAEYLTSTFELV